MRLFPGRIVRATVGADGPEVIDITVNPDGTVLVSGTGLDGEHTVPTHPLLGDADTGHEVVPAHRAVAEAMERYGEHRIAVTGTPYHDLLPAVLGQRVTGAEAVDQWRLLCLRWGTKVEWKDTTLCAPPSPQTLSAIPYHTLHRLGIDRRRADTLRNVARHGERLIRGWRPDLDASARTRSLELIPGVGRWTAAVAGWTAFGDPDALEVGDFHAKNTVAFALAGRHRGTDEEMCELLHPYAGHRQRVLQWLRMAGISAPAHGPRRRIVSIARL